MSPLPPSLLVVDIVDIIDIVDIKTVCHLSAGGCNPANFLVCCPDSDSGLVVLSGFCVTTCGRRGGGVDQGSGRAQAQQRWVWIVFFVGSQRQPPL